MKKLMILFLVLALLLPAAAMAEAQEQLPGSYAQPEIVELYSSVWYRLEPGLYHIGDTIPGGAYDVRYSDAGDGPLILTYSDLLTAGKPDLDFFYSYTISVDTRKWTGGAHPVIIVDNGGFLLVEGRSCRLYPVQIGY